MQLTKHLSCLNFWDEACWFLSLRFFRLLSSSLLLFPQHFGRYVLRPSSGVWNFELRPLWNHEGHLFWFRLPYPGTSVKYSCILLACSEDWTCNLQMIVFLEAQGTNAYNRYAKIACLSLLHLFIYLKYTMKEHYLSLLYLMVALSKCLILVINPV